MNEIIFFVEILLCFSGVVLAHYLLGKEGLVMWISVALVLANLTVTKAIVLFSMESALGNVLFASSFLATDILTELYGEINAKTAVKVGIGGILVSVVFTQIALAYQPSSEDVAHIAMVTVFNLNLKTSIVSIVLTYAETSLNVWIYARIKEATKGRYLWISNNISTIICNCGENLLFAVAVFWGVYSMQTIIMIVFTASVIEALCAVCDTPFFYLARALRTLQTRTEKL